MFIIIFTCNKKTFFFLKFSKKIQKYTYYFITKIISLNVTHFVKFLNYTTELLNILICNISQMKNKNI